MTKTQLGGYGLAFVGVCVYNYRKVTAMQQAAIKAPEKLDKAENGTANKANN